MKRGFTLIEVLLALVLVSVMALLAWRGIDSMNQAMTQTAQYEQNAVRLRMALAQWSADFDGLVDTGVIKALEFDGQSLRLTRRSTEPSGVVVVAWTLQSGRLLRYAAPAVTDKAALQSSRLSALRWARTPLPEDATRTVDLVAASNWQIFYYRGDAWTNAQSSAGATPESQVPTRIQPPSPGGLAAETDALPDGVRLVLDVSPGAGLQGKVTRDWIQPTLGATR